MGIHGSTTEGCPGASTCKNQTLINEITCEVYLVIKDINLHYTAIVCASIYRHPVNECIYVTDTITWQIIVYLVK